MVTPEYTSIKDRYKNGYKDALNAGRKQIQSFIEDWPAVLNQIETKIYQEIKTAGVSLYPIYPVENVFINFGNPFFKIGIEILYKTNGLKEKEEKLNILKKNGWTVYTFETKYTSFILEDLFNYVKDEYSRDCFEELEPEEKNVFIERYKEKNLECLIYHIMNEMSEY